jgi:hypothetical protein
MVKIVLMVSFAATKRTPVDESILVPVLVVDVCPSTDHSMGGDGGILDPVTVAEKSPCIVLVPLVT